MATYQYEPDYVALPGETLLEALEERGMSQTELAQRLGKSRKFVSEIVRGKAVIQLSRRYKTSDHLWFIFYHEAGHILLHGKTETYIEIQGQMSEKEAEADAFARDTLIPPAEWRRFMNARGAMTKQRIIEFANAQEIGPDGSIHELSRSPSRTRPPGNEFPRPSCESAGE